MLIVNYHYCHRPTDSLLSAVGSIPPERFTRQMRMLAEHYRPARLSHILERPDAGAGTTTVLVTFDDGLKCVLKEAVPVLREHGLSAVFFCSSAPLLERRVLDVHKIHLLQAKLGFERFRLGFMEILESRHPSWQGESWRELGLAPMYRYDGEEARRFKFLLNVELPYNILGDILDRLFDEHVGDQAEVASHLYMSKEDLQRCTDLGFAIGIHTHSHRMLSRLSRFEQHSELSAPLESLSEFVGDTPVLSYPYGIPGSWNCTSEELLAALGYAAAFTLGRSIVNYSALDFRYRIPRFDVNDVFTQEDRLASQIVDGRCQVTPQSIQ